VLPLNSTDAAIKRVKEWIGCISAIQRKTSFPLVFRSICTIFAARTKHVRIMTTVELNAQIWRDMAEIADSEQLMKQLAKYLKKLVAKKADPTLMTKEEFFAKVDKSLEQARQGRVHRIDSKEELDQFLNSL